MRKQDRIKNQQSRPQEGDESQSQSESQDRERMKGSGESEHMRGGGSESQRSPRQSGKLPLPD